MRQALVDHEPILNTGNDSHWTDRAGRPQALQILSRSTGATETPHLFWFIVGALALANICLLVFGLTGIRIFTKIVEYPKGVLIPLIIVLSAVGTYAIQNNPVHIYWMLLFGVIGYFMKMYGFQVGPVILGVILGPMMDSNYRRAMLGACGDIGTFFWNFVSHPITLVLSLALVAMLLSQTPLVRWFKRWRADTNGTK